MATADEEKQVHSGSSPAGHSGSGRSQARTQSRKASSRAAQDGRNVNSVKIDSEPRNGARGSKASQSYHHGDLRRTLLETAMGMVQTQGVAALNLRTLAAHVGVSQTAIYHHFSDKQALLCAIGEEGIKQLSAALALAMQPEPEQALATHSANELDNLGRDILEQFVTAYVRFALANPELYELMLGRTTWGSGTTDEFRNAALGTFRSFADLIASLQTRGALPATVNTLRLTQIIWGYLHGLIRMQIDGLMFTPDDVEEICRYAAKMLRHVQLPNTPT